MSLEVALQRRRRLAHVVCPLPTPPWPPNTRAAQNRQHARVPDLCRPRSGPKMTTQGEAEDQEAKPEEVSLQRLPEVSLRQCPPFGPPLVTR